MRWRSAAERIGRHLSAVAPSDRSAAFALRVACIFVPWFSLGSSALPAQPAPGVRDSVGPADVLQREYFFHRPDIDYGSAAAWGPLGLLGNRGLSTMQFEGVDRELSSIPWGVGFESTMDALLHPLAAIERFGGWGRFLRTEFVPSDWEVWTWAWAPNYSGHLLAGGISHRQLTEWFDHQGAPYPWLVAGVSYYATMLVNESIENRRGLPGPSGAVADLYFFDPAGMLLFSFDGVARFFAQTLQAADWSPQVSVTPTLTVLNHSQVIAYKVPLPLVDRVRLLFLIGQGSSTGVAVMVDDDYSIGGAVGFSARERFIDPVTGAESITPQKGGGLFLDRNGSLLASLVITGAERVEANVFPGTLPGWFGQLGWWAGLDSTGSPTLGVSTRRTYGLGFGLGR